MYVRSRRDAIGAHNVNDDWQDAGRAAKQTTNA
jgi:PiT family inorganic phosphate transporter